MTLTELLDLLRAKTGFEPRRSGKEWKCLCPAHADHEPSLSVRANHDKMLIHCFGGCPIERIVAALGLKMGDLRIGGNGGGRRARIGRVVATYDYRDEAGHLLFQSVRYEPKDFRFRRPDGDGWIWNLKGVARILYRLPHLVAADSDQWVFVCEGEKDCDNLAGIGLVATCNPGGAGKWKDLADDSALLKRRVCLVADKDRPGRKHTQDVAGRLQGKAAEVKVIELPGDEVKDASDHITAMRAKNVTDADIRAGLLNMADAAPEWKPENGAGSQADEDPNRFPLTDAGNAELLAAREGHRLRYDHRRGRWLLWQGHSWGHDADGLLKRLCIGAARARFRAAADESDRKYQDTIIRWARRSESAPGISATLTLAQAIPPITDAGDGWDERPDLLVVQNGVIDLRTGELHPGRREDKLSFSVALAFDPDARAPRWERFLREVFADSEQLVAFMRRALGYILTGHTREQCFFLCYGTGANGKGKLLGAITNVLGEGQLAHTTAFSTFEDMRGSMPHPEAVAELAGRRLVCASETTERHTLHEGRIKSLSHGDPQSARFMYGQRFVFTPQAKIVLAVNYKPVVRDDSLGFWRSAFVVPFKQRFDPSVEPNLGDVLRSEAQGILADMVRGAVEWYAHGLQPPECVLLASDEWKRESDPIGEFLRARCTIGSDVHATAKALYDAYERFAESEGVPKHARLTVTGFGLRLSERFRKIRPSGGQPTKYMGVGLLCEPSEAGAPL